MSLRRRGAMCCNWPSSGCAVILLLATCVLGAENGNGGPDIEASLLNCLASEGCSRRLTGALSGNASNTTAGSFFDLKVNPLLVEFKDADAALNLGSAAEQAGKITLGCYADLRGLVNGADGAGTALYGTWSVPIILKVALLAFTNGLVMDPPARRAPVTYQMLWADTCKDPEAVQTLTTRCSVPYAMNLTQPLIFGRGADIAPAHSYIPRARALLGGNKWTTSVALNAGGQGLPNLGFWSSERALSDKRVYPSFVRTNPTDRTNFQAYLAVLQHLRFTSTDALACDTAKGRDTAAYYIDVVTSSGVAATTFYVPPEEYTVWLAGDSLELTGGVRKPEVSLNKKLRWDLAISGMKAFNAHAHTSFLDSDCAHFDVMHYFALNGLAGGGHLWLGLSTSWVLYEGPYFYAATTLCMQFYKTTSAYANVTPMDNYIFVDGTQSGGRKAAFWSLMDFVGQDQATYLDELAGLIPSSAFTDPSTYSWNMPQTDYLVDATFALLYAINDLVLEVGEGFTNSQLRERISLTDFQGITGRIRFDADGDRIMELQVLQYRFPPGTRSIYSGLKGDIVQVGTYVRNLMATAPFRFTSADGLRWSPPPDKDLECEVGKRYDRQNGVCSICAPGSFTSRTGMSQCEPCVPGSYAPGNGSSSCMPCPEGFAAPTSGSVACTPCEPGWFNDAVQQSSCRQCERGTYAQEGSSICVLCPPGMYAEGRGHSVCDRCEGLLTTAFAGSMSTADCVCPAGTYRDTEMRKVCHDCPLGMLCELGSDEAYFPLVLAQNCTGAPGDRCVIPVTGPRYMTRKEEPLRSFLCLYPEACPGGPPGTCGANRDSDMVACGRCVYGTHMERKSCTPCPKSFSSLGLALACTAAVVVLAGTVFAVNRDLILQSNSTLSVMVICGIMLTSIQTMGVFRNLALEWFEPLSTIFSALALISFNLDALNFGCVFRPNPPTMYLFRQMAGPICLVVIGVTVIIKKRFRPHVDLLVEYANSAGTAFGALFISIASSCVLPLICYKHPGNNGESLLGDPVVLCWESRDHTFTIVVGGLTFVLVLVPFMVIILYGTINHNVFVAQSARGTGRGLSGYRFLFYRFQPHAYYYGSFLMVRGLLICFVPVVIRYDVAFQVCVMSAILLLGQALQLQIQPWRSLLTNIVDGAATAGMILFLICGSSAADMSASKTSIKLLGTLVFSGLCAAVIIGFFVCMVRYLRPTPWFQWFICHHKRDAAAQARLLKIIMQQRSHSVFIDSDDLKDLDQLFDVVKSAVGHLLVYLTRDVLTRPWCAGEIATTVRKGTRLTAIRTPSWIDPTEEDIKPESLPSYLDLSSTTLQQYSISFETVSAAYKFLLSPAVRKVAVPEEVCGQARFHTVVGELLGRPVVEHPAQPCPGMLLVSSDASDDEATASAAILVSKVQLALFSVMPEPALLLVDGAISDKERMNEAVWAARAVAVVLSKNSLQVLQQLEVIACSMERLTAAKFKTEEVRLPPFEVIPLTTPNFQFPEKAFYETTLPKIWLAEEFNAKEMGACLKRFFKRLAVNFSTHASDAILDSQALQLVERVPHKWTVAGTVMDDIRRVRSSSRASETFRNYSVNSMVTDTSTGATLSHSQTADHSKEADPDAGPKAIDRIEEAAPKADPEASNDDPLMWADSETHPRDAETVWTSASSSEAAAAVAARPPALGAPRGRPQGGRPCPEPLWY